MGRRLLSSRYRGCLPCCGSTNTLLEAPGVTNQECSRALWDAAIEIWVQACTRNKRQEDADTIIAAFAQNLNTTVVTDNLKHFSSLEVPTESWT